MTILGGLRRIHVHLLLAVLALLLARPRLATNMLGTLLVVAGLLVRVWAAGVLEKGGDLCTDGPYRHVRHPLYLASFIAALGFCVMMDVVWAWLVVLPIFVAIYAAQAILEERRLRAEFGEAHAEYARRVPMILPRLRADGGQGRRWQLHRVRVNREHYHLLVTSLLVAAFYVKQYLQAA